MMIGKIPDPRRPWTHVRHTRHPAPYRARAGAVAVAEQPYDVRILILQNQIRTVFFTHTIFSLKPYTKIDVQLYDTAGHAELVCIE